MKRSQQYLGVGGVAAALVAGADADAVAEPAGARVGVVGRQGFDEVAGVEGLDGQPEGVAGGGGDGLFGAHAWWPSAERGGWRASTDRWCPKWAP
ncbi:hypothetical protein [Streptomyces sp. NPDC006368]|uniref:hypothetical protein n=1 Tax=Streptomyces sp. NPDC006368 TaxID=3156760 RepID=UPI0033BE0732